MSNERNFRTKNFLDKDKPKYKSDRLFMLTVGEAVLVYVATLIILTNRNIKKK